VSLLNKIKYHLHLSEECQTELSDIIYEEGIVSSKNYEEEDDGIATGIVMGVALDDLSAGAAYGCAMSEDEEYNIGFKGKNVSFDFDDEDLYNTYELGEKVIIAYKQRCTSFFDFVPPNYSKKVFIEKKFSGKKFVGVEKIK